MNKNTLAFISNALKAEQIPYCLGQWSKVISYPYFVGEYIDSEPVSESGESQGVFILTGFGLSDRLSLERIKERIERLFPVYGKTRIFEDNSAAAVMFMSAAFLPVESDEIKKIEIKLRFKEWRVNI